MAEKYGNLPFGQVYKLLISIIGRDAALAISKEQGIHITEKILDRIFGEEDINFVHFRPNEKTDITKIYRNFFEILEDKYSLPCFVYDVINSRLGGTFRNALKGTENPTKELEGIIPYEMPTPKLILLILLWSLGDILNGSCKSDADVYTITKESVSRLLEDSYKNIFDKVTKNKKDFYEQLDKFYVEKHPDSDDSNERYNFVPNFSQTIRRYCEGNQDITWEKLKLILDFINSEYNKVKCEKELSHRIIGLYLLKNTETILKKLCGDEYKDNIDKIKKDILLWANNELPSDPQSDSQRFLLAVGEYKITNLSILQKHFISIHSQRQIEAILECGGYLWGENSIEPDRAEQLIREMEEKCPHCGVFFGNWARARLAVLSCKFDGSEADNKFQKEALEFYQTAFDEGRNYAGAYLKAFLEESIAATVYFNRRRIQDIPEVIYTNKKLREPKKKLKTPITTGSGKKKENQGDKYGAKRYYEYGYALNFFEQESEETYFLHFHAEEHFWKVFPAYQFTNAETAEQKCKEDLLKAKRIYPSYIDTNNVREVDKWVTFTKHTEKRKSVTEKTINRRMEIRPGHNVQYTPLSIALITHQLDIAEHYLNNFADLDVTVINTHGSTALGEALTQYKNKRFSKKDKQKTERYKKIIMELIKCSPVGSLYAETVKGHISILEEAINAFDIEIVRAIVEKKGFDIQNLKINADELSPLYYAVMRLYYVNQAISKGYIGNTSGNITWKNLDVPGIFQEDKQRCMENMKSDPDYKMVEQLSTLQYIGDPSVWKQEFEEIKEIVKYLIDKTDSVDAFAKRVPNGNPLTVLDLAVESDFDDICRQLIEKGANPIRIFCKNGMPYESPFIRAVYYKAWKTSEMLLTDFKDKIKTILNERFMEDKQTAAHLLFKGDYGPIQYPVNNENFKRIEHFIPLFRSAGTDFGIPDDKGITVKKLLEIYNMP
jgi:hypothetical protein